MSIQEDADKVLRMLAEFEQTPGDSQRGRYSVDALTISKTLGLEPERLDDAIQHLEDEGALEVARHLGTAPFAFKGAEVTKDGRLLYEEMQAKQPTTATGTTETATATKGQATPMANAEVLEARAAAKSQGWFITTEKLGEGGGGIAYLAARASALEAIRARAQGLQSLDEVSRNTNAIGLVRLLTNVMGPASDQLGVFKSTKQAPERMKREIKALSTLEHRNLVRVFAADPGEQPTWYLMEFFEAGDLTHSWPRFQGQAREVLTRIRELAQGVGTVHQAGLVHRDIKPDNIFIGADGRWVLGDFGIAFEAGATRHTEQGPTPMTKEWRPDWVVSRRLEEFTAAVDIFRSSGFSVGG